MAVYFGLPSYQLIQLLLDEQSAHHVTKQTVKKLREDIIYLEKQRQDPTDEYADYVSKNTPASTNEVMALKNKVADLQGRLEHTVEGSEVSQVRTLVKDRDMYQRRAKSNLDAANEWKKKYQDLLAQMRSNGAGGGQEQTFNGGSQSAHYNDHRTINNNIILTPDLASSAGFIPTPTPTATTPQTPHRAPPHASGSGALVPSRRSALVPSRSRASVPSRRATPARASTSTVSFNNLAIRSAETPWLPPVPKYSDPCDKQGKCKRGQCAYVHEDQKEPYKDTIAGLKYRNREEEAAAIDDGVMDLD